MVINFEVKHTLIHGTTGSGKGQTFNQCIEQIRARGESAIIVDKGCVFTSLFYHKRTDTLLNPFDRRCAPWDLWQEATTAPDFDNMAEALIPMQGESDPYWVSAARTVFAAAAYRMREESDRCIEKLLALLLTGRLDNLSNYLQDTIAATLVSDKIAKTAISIRSVLSTSLKSLRFLQEVEGKALFSIRQWIAQAGDSKESRFLFISSNAEQNVTLRPLVSAAEIMALPDLSTYVRLPLPVPITKIKLTYQSRVAKQSGFIARNKTADKKETTNQNKSLMPPHKNKRDSNKIPDINQLKPDDPLPNNTSNPLARLQQQKDDIVTRTLDENIKYQDEIELPKN